MTNNKLDEKDLRELHYPKLWLENFLFMKRVMKELCSGGFCLLQVTHATSRGVWCAGSYHVMNDAGFYVGYADFKIFYRHSPNNWKLDDKDTNWRLMWAGPISRRLAYKHDLTGFIDDSIMDAIRKVRDLEEHEAKVNQ